MEDEIDDEMKPSATIHFDFETIRVATDDFSDANKLGRGGFGPVYKVRKYYICLHSEIYECLS